MGEYIVSARKYRPSAFDAVVGQEALTTTLKNAIAAGKLAHAYLFCGPRGVGKTTCARIFAKTINCLHPSDNGEACDECESCKAFNEQRSLNIHELDAASNNSVEEIRALIEKVRIPPQVGRYKVFIIDEVHMLSTAAFNAFLKTLEEPPSYVIFILATTEKHKILPTILSRCQVYDFNRMSVQTIVNHLKFVADKEGYAYEPEALNIIAQKADGGMRDALSIFDQTVSFTGGNLTYKKVIEKRNDTVLLVIGRGMEETSIKNLAKDMGLENSVRFLGVRNDVADILNACDCFLLPSLYEGLPVVLIETQTNGLTAIVSDRVTTELAVTDVVEFLPISEDAVEIWADKICSYKPLTMDLRKNYFKKIEQAGYDIISASKNMEDFYLKEPRS